MTKERFDIYQHITDQIITTIEQGAGAFQLPWHKKAVPVRPINVASLKAYRGVNIVTLWAAAEQRGFTSGIWGTYRQWAEAKAQVRKGERSSYVIFCKEIEISSSDEDEEVKTRLMARATPVFAAEQVEGYTQPEKSSPQLEPIAAADAFVQATQAVIRHGGNVACYDHSTDSIRLPVKSDFKGTATISSQEAYYATLLHELTHWTAPKQRCDRQFGSRFGDHAYAMEELTAELGAAFLCADLGITADPRADHAQYLASWLKVLKADKRAIFTAASAASKAADYLHGLQARPSP
jgi:antirestriction protein ArdC